MKNFTHGNFAAGGWVKGMIIVGTGAHSSNQILLDICKKREDIILPMVICLFMFLLRSFNADIEDKRHACEGKQQDERSGISAACHLKRGASRCDKRGKHQIEIADA